MLVLLGRDDGIGVENLKGFWNDRWKKEASYDDIVTMSLVSSYGFFLIRNLNTHV